MSPNIQGNNQNTYVSFDELRKVDVPKFERYGIGEKLDTTFIYLEALLEVFVLFQESSVVDDDLSVGYPQLEDLVVDRFR